MKDIKWNPFKEGDFYTRPNHYPDNFNSFDREFCRQMKSLSYKHKGLDYELFFLLCRGSLNYVLTVSAKRCSQQCFVSWEFKDDNTFIKQTGSPFKISKYIEQVEEAIVRILPSARQEEFLSLMSFA